MDEFGVLVESIGFRAAHGKSAPMAKPKPKPKSHFTPNATPSFNDSYSLPVDELDGIFRSNVSIGKNRQSQNSFVDDDIFGVGSNQYGGVDLESVLSGTNNNRKSNGGNLDLRSSVGFSDDDLLGGSKLKQGDPVDDLLGGSAVNISGNEKKKEDGLDDLLSGFGGASSAKTRVYSETNLFPESNGHPFNLSSTADDPFLVFESSVSDSSWPFTGALDQGMQKGSHQYTIDDFDGFVTGGARSGSKVEGIKTATNKSSSKQFEDANYPDDIFGGTNAMQQNKSNNAARPSSMAQNSLFGDFFHGEEPGVKQAPSRRTSSSKQASSATHVGGDFTSLFGDVTTSSGEFHEIEGEPAERRRARLKRHLRMNERMAEALAEKNQRDLQSQHEQEEKRRLAEILDNDIKRWAAGKEGNLRALLSSLQQVLWPESGWRAVSLTDMITSESVKKIYMKSNLYVHPDKVQQRGANLQQKYVAEKVFDILKEAWNKFSAEELR